MKWHDRLANGVLPFMFLLIVLPVALEAAEKIWRLTPCGKLGASNLQHRQYAGGKPA